MLKASRTLAGLLAAAAVLASADRAAAQSTSAASQQPAGTAADKEPLRYEDTASVEAKAPAVPPPADTATKLEANVRDIPASVSVVSGRLAAEQAGLVLGDALKNASGVNVATGFGVFDYWVVRGFDTLDTGLVLVDGAADPEATFYPLYNVQQVEVLKGPGAFAWGGGALSGTTQVVRKNPAIARFADLTLSYGRFGTYAASVDGNASSSSGKLAFRLNATLQGSDGFRDGRDGQIAGFNPGLAWRPDARTRVALSYEYLTSDQSPDSGLPFVDGALAGPSRETSYQSASDLSDQGVHRFRADAQRRLNDTFLLRDKLYYSKLDWDSHGTLIVGAFPFPPDFRTYVVRTQGLLDDSQRLFGNQLELVASFRTGSVSHELVSGVEFSQLKDTYTQDAQLVQPLDLMQPVEFEVGIYPIPIPQAHQEGDSRSLVLAPYVIDRLTLSPKLEILAGARLDSVDFEDDATATTRDETRVSPLAGITWKPVPTVSVYASGGLGFAPPSIQVVGPRDPEESTQLEGGVKVSFLEGKGYASAAVYHLERENVAIPDSTGLTRQSGSQRAQGFELELSAEPRKGWSVRANYAFNDAELTEFAELVQTGQGFFVLDRSGNVPAFAPRHIGSLWATAPLPYGLSLAAGLRCLSDQFVSADNRNKIDTYAVADAAIFYTRGRARVGLHLRNLTSTEYATRGFGSESAIPGRPFEVMGRVELGFGSR